MKNYYSRGKRLEQEFNFKHQQSKYENHIQESRRRQRQLITRTNSLRQQQKINDAKKRIEEIQRQEKERLAKKDHRDKYIQYLRSNRGRSSTRERSNNSEASTMNALDLHVCAPPSANSARTGSKIPKPNTEKAVKFQHDIENTMTKIPRFQMEPSQEFL